ASSLLILYVLFTLELERPVLAGLCLGCAFMTRTTTALAVVLFVAEALRVHQRAADSALSADAHPAQRFAAFLRNADWPRVIKVGLLFAAPVCVAIAAQLWMNAA